MHVLVGVEGPAEGGEQGGGQAQHGGGPGGAGPSRHRDRSAHSIHKLFDRAGQSDVKITASSLTMFMLFLSAQCIFFI